MGSYIATPDNKGTESWLLTPETSTVGMCYIATPDNKGTERLIFLALPYQYRLRCRTTPDNKGTERECAQPGTEVLSRVAEPLPITRGLKVDFNKLSFAAQSLLQNHSR